VRLAQHTETREWFAVKFLPDSRAAREEVRWHAESYARSERGVVRPVEAFVFDFRMQGERVSRRWLALVMDRMQGGELYHEIVRRGRLGEADAASVTRQLAEALRAMHASGIVHRDIKPENILLETPDSMEHVRLADFGMAFGGTRPTSSCFTAYFAAPEVLLAHASSAIPGTTLLSSKCDMWSLGVSIYVMLCGRQPFFSAAQQRSQSRVSCELRAAVRNGAFNKTSPEYLGLSEDAKEVICSLLRTSPDQRWSADELLQSKWLNPSSATHVGGTSTNIGTAATGTAAPLPDDAAVAGVPGAGVSESAAAQAPAMEQNMDNQVRLQLEKLLQSAVSEAARLILAESANSATCPTTPSSTSTSTSTYSSATPTAISGGRDAALEDSGFVNDLDLIRAEDA
jgi:serine/threonine protein kinase